MKTITFRVPTSIAEFRQMRKERISKRYRNNVQVIRDVIDGIIEIACNGYWRGDISETMISRLFHSSPYCQDIEKLYEEAKSKLK